MTAMALATLLALPLGILSALWRNSVVDTSAMLLALSGQCMPTFWLGILLILVFAVHLRWVPVYGGDGLSALVLPALALGVWAMARTARITRSTMLEVLSQDFLRTARAKGLSEWAVVLRHGLRNGAIPIVTALGLELGNLLGGAVITEAVFAYPGIGRLAVEAVVNKDVPLIQVVVFTVATALVSLNIIIDLVYVRLDPRVRLGYDGVGRRRHLRRRLAGELAPLEIGPGHPPERGPRQDSGRGARYQRPGEAEGPVLEGAGDDLRGRPHHQGVPAVAYLWHQQPS
jgi:glutathione transport system permease protein